MRYERKRKWYMRWMGPGSNGLCLVKTSKPRWQTPKADIPIPAPGALLKIFREVYYPVGILFED